MNTLSLGLGCTPRCGSRNGSLNPGWSLDVLMYCRKHLLNTLLLGLGCTPRYESLNLHVCLDILMYCQKLGQLGCEGRFISSRTTYGWPSTNYANVCMISRKKRGNENLKETSERLLERTSRPLEHTNRPTPTHVLCRYTHTHQIAYGFATNCSLSALLNFFCKNDLIF